jgi:acyl-coenzyme A thioesterase 9
MKLEQEIASNVWIPMLEAKFLLCARDTHNVGSAAMNQLEVLTDEEKAVFELGRRSQEWRLREAELSLMKTPPNAEESLLAHEMFKKTIDLA